MIDRTRRAFLGAIGVTGLGALAGCGGAGPGGSPTDSATSAAMDASATTSTEAGMGSTTTKGDQTASPTNEAATTTPAASASGPTWLSAELTDVLSGETFTVGQFDAPVILESFAVWCPVCTRQQEVIGAVLNDVEDVVAVSLNTDPNEDAQKVKNHSTSKRFDWRYAISPPDVTRSLVDDFGPVITNAPAAPVIRVCPRGAADLLEGSGVKSASTIEAALEEC